MITINVLIIDNSMFFRRKLAEIIDAVQYMTVIDVAKSAKDIIGKRFTVQPDVIIMDIESPNSDGLAAMKTMMKEHTAPILFYCSPMHQHLVAEMDAFSASGTDLLLKDFNTITDDEAAFSQRLQKKLLELAYGKKKNKALLPYSRPQAYQTMEKRLARKINSKTLVDNEVRPSAHQSLSADTSLFVRELNEKNDDPLTLIDEDNDEDITLFGLKTQLPKSAVTDVHHLLPSKIPIAQVTAYKDVQYELTIFAASTGGPSAIHAILSHLSSDYPTPIVVVIHMPAGYTRAFAERLNESCDISVVEASNHQMLVKGCVYIAPGGMQLEFEQVGSEKRVIVFDDNSKDTVKPSVDQTFQSAALVFGHKVLAVVLTGMGSDGKEGAKRLKESGAKIWAQDKQTCVVYGMPYAVSKANISSEDIPLEWIASRVLLEVMKHK